MRYAHFAKICEKCGKVPNMQRSNIRVLLTCLIRDPACIGDPASIKGNTVSIVVSFLLTSSIRYALTKRRPTRMSESDHWSRVTPLSGLLPLLATLTCSNGSSANLPRNYTERLKRLNLDSLELQRLRVDLVWCYEVIFGRCQ